MSSATKQYYGVQTFSINKLRPGTQEHMAVVVDKNT